MGVYIHKGTSPTMEVTARCAQTYAASANLRVHVFKSGLLRQDMKLQLARSFLGFSVTLNYGPFSILRTNDGCKLAICVSCVLLYVNISHTTDADILKLCATRDAATLVRCIPLKYLRRLLNSD